MAEVTDLDVKTLKNTAYRKNRITMSFFWKNELNPEKKFLLLYCIVVVCYFVFNHKTAEKSRT